MRRWIPAAAAAVALTVVSGLAGAQNDLLRDPISFPDVRPGNNNIDYDSIDYAVRRGWFSGHSDGTFDPLGRLTSTHLVRVIDRAFPDGMTRGEFAALLTGGEWAAKLTPGRRPTNPIPIGQAWQVGDWDIRVREAWPQNGWDKFQSSYTGSLRSPPSGRQYTLVQIEVVYRGTQRTGSFDLGYKVVSDRKEYEGSSCRGWSGNLRSDATDIRPGAPVSSELCWSTDHGDNPNVMQIWKGSERWAWFSLTGRAGGNDLLQDPVEFLDIESGNSGNIDYAVRRGWFEGKADGRFDPLGRLTSAQLVRVIDRAFPDGMRRGEFAALLTGGEWAAKLTPGQRSTNPIPFGQTWRVGDWDIRFLELWPQDGYTELQNRNYGLGGWGGQWQNVKDLTIVDVEAVYRGTRAATGSFFDNLRYKITSDQRSYTSGCVGYSTRDRDSEWTHSERYRRVQGPLVNVATNIKPGAPVHGLLCRITDPGDTPNLMQIWDGTKWAWFEL